MAAHRPERGGAVSRQRRRFIENSPASSLTITATGIAILGRCLRGFSPPAGPMGSEAGYYCCALGAFAPPVFANGHCRAYTLKEYKTPVNMKKKRPLQRE